VARNLDAKCRQCRREGEKLFLKGEKCFTDKCAIERRNYPPGQHGQKNTRLSGYGVQLREKQKVRRIYGLLERQFRLSYHEATTMRGRTGEEMIGLLERRLDNVVYRMGFASTRAQGRQLVRHNHVLINGKRVNIPSYRVGDNDKVEIREKSRKVAFVAAALTAAQGRQVPSWVEVDKANFSGTLKSLPPREELNEPSMREQLVVEYYSR